MFRIIFLKNVSLIFIHHTFLLAIYKKNRIRENVYSAHILLNNIANVLRKKYILSVF